MNSTKLIITILTIFILSESCTSHKGYFSVSHHNQAIKPKLAVKQQTILPEELPIISKETPVNEPVLTASNAVVMTVENAVKANKYEEKIKTALRKVEQPNTEIKANEKVVKMNFVQKIIVKKIQKKMAKNNTLVGFNDWNSFLKIGAILLGIGIVLAIFGLGAIGGLSALIGLIFAILGLLEQV
ncbi:MAG: hypothetical protein U5N85_20760 [Arcicella sp.]|nr:hypothetical protein [Arcicella sp.]